MTVFYEREAGKTDPYGPQEMAHVYSKSFFHVYSQLSSFCLSHHLCPYFVVVNSEGSGKTG